MKKKVLLFIITMFVSITSYSYDIAVKNADGVIIYYNKINDSELGVTYGNSKYSGKVVIPETVTYEGKTYNVTSIGTFAFCECRGLTSITIPNSVTGIGGGAFYHCTGLTSAIIGNSVTSIGDYAFYECTGLTSATIGNSVTSIGKAAFFECTGLTSVNIPSSVTSIGGAAFYKCRGLTAITIPNSVTSIGSGTFRDCTGLTSITIPNSVKSIGEYAFWSCTGLTSVSIGNGVTDIGNNAFKDCNLRNLLIKCVAPPKASAETFSDQTFNHAALYVPANCKDAYAYDNVWYKFINIHETTTSEEQLSTQQAYTMMDMNTFDYSVYDPVNNSVGTISSAVGIDENNPNHSWQTMKSGRMHFLYNIGARKYVKRNGNGFELKETPEPIDMEEGDKGIIFGGQTDQQWALVSNGRISVVQSAVEEVANIGNAVMIDMSEAGYATFFDSRNAYALPKSLSAQVVTSASNNKLTYKTIADGSTSGIVPKGTAVMLSSDQKSSGTFTLTATVGGNSYSGANLLRGSDEKTTTEGDGYHYKLSYGQTGTEWDDVFGWYWGAKEGAPFQIGGHKAWLVVPKSAVTRAYGGYTIDDDATGITDMETGDESSNVYFDIQGRRISTPTSRGLYIKNGKKVIIK